MLIHDDPEPRDDDELEGPEPADADEPEAGDEVETPADDDEPDADVIDVDDEPEPEPEPAPRKKAAPSRSEEENFAALRRRKDAEIAARDVEIERLRRAGEQPRAATREDPEAEARRLAAMTPEQRLDYKQAKFEERMVADQQRVRFETWEAADKANYQAKASVNPRYARFSAEVEKQLGIARQQGLNFNREQVLAFIIGNQVMNAKGSKGAKKQAAEAEASVRDNKVRPSRPKGDTAPDRSTNEKAARKKRLEGMQI